MAMFSPRLPGVGTEPTPRSSFGILPNRSDVFFDDPGDVRLSAHAETPTDRSARNTVAARATIWRIDSPDVTVDPDIGQFYQCDDEVLSGGLPLRIFQEWRDCQRRRQGLPQLPGRMYLQPR